MSEFAVEVVKLDEIEPHPNADKLEIALVHGGYPVIIRKGEFAVGDLAVYVPINALVPLDDPRFSFLRSNRIKAMRLRGVFSMGLLVKPNDDMTEGQNVQECMGITRWLHPSEREEDTNMGVERKRQPNYADDEQLPDPSIAPVYDLEAYRKFGKHALVEGEEVIITEKLHGENCRVFWSNDRMYVGSRTRFKKPEAKGNWWTAARNAGLDTKLQNKERFIVYGESYGYTGGFPYDAMGLPQFRCFDVLDVVAGRWLNVDEMDAFCAEHAIPQVPLLYRGAWDSGLLEMCEGRSSLNANHMREGIVIRPTQERWDRRCGRVVLKHVSEEFILRNQEPKS